MLLCEQKYNIYSHILPHGAANYSLTTGNLRWRHHTLDVLARIATAELNPPSATLGTSLSVDERKSGRLLRP